MLLMSSLNMEADRRQEVCGAPPSLQSPLLQLQWVSAALRRLETERNHQGAPLSTQHPLVSGLLGHLSSPTSDHVTSCCLVLRSACIRHGWVEQQDLLTSLISCAVSAIVYVPILETISLFLEQEMLDIVESCSVYICPYSLRANVHPFISVLNSRPEAGMAVANQIISILRLHHASQYSVQLVEPVLKHIFLQPAPPTSSSSLCTHLHCQLTLLATTLGVSTVQGEGAGVLVDLMMRMLPLQPTNSSDQLLSAASAASRLLPLSPAFTPSSYQILLDHTCNLVLELTQHALPVAVPLDIIATLLKNPQCVRARHVLCLSCVLLRHLLSPQTTLSLLLIMKELMNATSLSAHLSSLLMLPLVQLLSQPSSSLQLLDHAQTLSECRQHAVLLLKQIESCDIEGGGRQGNEACEAAVHVCSGSLSCMDSLLQQYLHTAQRPELVGVWLETTGHGEAAESAVLIECKAVLVAALASQCKHRPEVFKSSLKAFIGLAQVLPKLTPTILPCLLHLMKSIPDPGSKLEVLHCIPKLATHSCCAGSVLAILRVLGGDPSLLPLATRLIGEAWQQQDHLYPHVREFLTRPMPSAAMTSDLVREAEVARAAVIRDICRLRAEQHGEQMLNLISRVLSSHYHDALQVAMALEGVVSLCQHEVVDVVTVWTVLGKGGRLTSDLRPAVQVALCSLFGLATELNSDLSHSHKVFKTSALQYLWRSMLTKSEAVSSAALTSLASFQLADFLLEQLPSQVTSLLPAVESREGGWDLGSALPLTGSQCVQLLHFVPRSALPSYSVFLGSVLAEEVGGVARGAVHSAMKQASVPLPHETQLRAKAAVLARREFTKAELASGYAKCCALMGIRSHCNTDPPQGRVRKKELQRALDRTVAILKDVLGACSGLLMPLEGVALWEGLAAYCASGRWEVMGDLCEAFSQVRLTAVNSDLQAITPRQQLQAHNWSLRQALTSLENCLKENDSSAASVFMAAVGVASWPSPALTLNQSDSSVVEYLKSHSSLLMDLLDGSLMCVLGEGHVTFSHDIVQLVMKEAGSSTLQSAVILSLPLLYRAVCSHWGAATPPSVMEKLSVLVGKVFDLFNSMPNWYTSMVLNELFLRAIPGSVELLVNLSPFLEAATQRRSLDLLSLTATFIPSLLTRNNHQLALGLLAALQETLVDADPSLQSSQLCGLHLAVGVVEVFAVGILSEEAAMKAVTLLAAMATKAPQEGLLQWSVGVVLHGLSMYGHRQACSLAENVGAKWLQQLREGVSAQPTEIVPVLLGMTGLVGVEPVRGVAWKSVSGPVEYIEMVLTVAYLLVDTCELFPGGCHAILLDDELMECILQLSQHEAEQVRTLSLWIATHTATEVIDKLSVRERVPADYSYLPPTSALSAVFSCCLALTSESVTDDCTTLLTSLVQSLTRGAASSPLPPADYSSLFLPTLRQRGLGSEFSNTCVQCFIKTKEGQGFKHLVEYWTLPHVFPALQNNCQILLFENLVLLMPALLSSQRLQPFLLESLSRLTSDLPLLHPLLAALLKGVATALAAGVEGSGVHVCLSRVVGGAYEAVSDTVDRLRRDSACSVSTLSSILKNDSLWREMAHCLALVPAQEMSCSSSVSLAVCSFLILSSSKPFKFLKTGLDWVVRSLPRMLGEEDGKVRADFRSCIQSLLKVVECSCSPGKCKDFLLHQTELLHMLSACTGELTLSEDQWKFVLQITLLPFSGGCSHLPPLINSSLGSDILGALATHPPLGDVPSSPAVREKLMQCLLEWLGVTTSEVIRSTILGYFGVLKSCEEYRKKIGLWTTVAHFT